MAIPQDVQMQSSATTDTDRSLQTTFRNHLVKKNLNSSIVRNYSIMRLLGSKGRMLYNQSGNGFDWAMQYRVHDVQTTDGVQPSQFDAPNLWVTANMEYRGYEATDSYTKKDKKANRGKQGRIKLAADLVKNLTRSMHQKQARQLYNDGSAVGNSGWHGMNTMLKHATSGAGKIQLIQASDGVVVDGDNAGAKLSYAVAPGGYYAGVPLSLGAKGGAVTGGTWPDGYADPEYDFNSPLIVNTNCSLFGSIPSGSTGWKANGRAVLSWSILYNHRNGPIAGNVDFVVMDRSMYFEIRDSLVGQERSEVGTNTVLRSFGFKNTFEIDGVECTLEYAVPATSFVRTSATLTEATYYGFNMENITLRCMDDVLYEIEGPEYDMTEKQYKVRTSTDSNFQFESARCFFKGFAASAAA